MKIVRVLSKGQSTNTMRLSSFSLKKEMCFTWPKAGPATGINLPEYLSSLYEKKLKIFYSEYEYFLQNFQANEQEYKVSVICVTYTLYKYF